MLCKRLTKLTFASSLERLSNGKEAFRNAIDYLRSTGGSKETAYGLFSLRMLPGSRGTPTQRLTLSQARQWEIEEFYDADVSGFRPCSFVAVLVCPDVGSTHSTRGSRAYGVR